MTVGFDRFVARRWMDWALELASADIEVRHAREQLSASLADTIEGPEARRKTIRLISNIWLSPRREAAPLRGDAPRLRDAEIASTLPLHWGMSMAAYPFFMAVAETAGRLLRLHEAFDSSQIKQRVQEIYGERSTVVRAVQRVLQCLEEWGVLEGAGRAGRYRKRHWVAVDSPRLSAWLVEALLRAKRAEAADLSSLLASPAFFAFRLRRPNSKQLPASGRLIFRREGASRGVVSLSSQMTAPSTA